MTLLFSISSFFWTSYLSGFLDLESRFLDDMVNEMPEPDGKSRREEKMKRKKKDKKYKGASSLSD